VSGQAKYDCDYEGNLLFYTNGCNILDASHEVMDGGEMINPGQIWDDFCDVDDYPSSQDVIALPDRYQDWIYHLIHKKTVNMPTNPGIDTRRPELLMTTIDMTLNDGLGKVIAKNVQVDSTYNYCSGYGEAISHANQLDWWYVDFQEGTNLIIKYLLTDQGMEEVSSQNIGEVLTDDYCAIAGQTSFSPDGRLIAKHCPLTGLDVMSFDRETGELGDLKSVMIPTSYSACGLSFSPNSQFVYVSTTDSLWQVDVTVDNLEDGLECHRAQPRRWT